MIHTRIHMSGINNLLAKCNVKMNQKPVRNLFALNSLNLNSEMYAEITYDKNVCFDNN